MIYNFQLSYKRRCSRPTRQPRPRSRTCRKFSWRTGLTPDSNFPPMERPTGIGGGFGRLPSRRFSSSSRSRPAAAAATGPTRRRGCESCGEQFPRGLRRRRWSSPATKATTTSAFATFSKTSTTTTSASSATTTDLTSAPGPMLIRRTIQQLYNDHIWSKF